MRRQARLPDLGPIAELGGSVIMTNPSIAT